MSDNLEKFINNHREEFDDALPNIDIWAGIEKELGQAPSAKVVSMPPQRNKWSYLGIAASIVLLLGLGIFIGRQTVSSGTGMMAGNEQLMTEIEDVRQYYEKEVQAKQVKLKRYNESKNVLSDVEEIDENITELLEELKHIPRGEEEHIIGLIIEHYRTKVAILEKVLDHLEKKSNKQEDGNQINI